MLRPPLASPDRACSAQEALHPRSMTEEYLQRSWRIALSAPADTGPDGCPFLWRQLNIFLFYILHIKCFLFYLFYLINDFIKLLIMEEIQHNMEKIRGPGGICIVTAGSAVRHGH
jgi:hypothetical protein